ncbi:MAG TPA: pesticidal protein Cry26Aa [Candidatus Brachybacterium merdigallinarum]|jgi:multicomponent Na+:H+ antiporter subunit F|nr:pesticidal protein Cry26Aa [Candidatus Brachybacterium merdigallinarum]
MILIDIATVGCGIALLIAAVRIILGPTPADRVVSADLLTFSAIALIALLGTRMMREGTFDLVLVATMASFLTGISLARALVRGRR